MSLLVLNDLFATKHRPLGLQPSCYLKGVIKSSL